MLRRYIALFRNLFRRSTVDRELDEELRSTMDILIREHVRQGIPPGEAHRQAMIELGGVEQVKEGIRSVKTGRLLRDLHGDLRFGMRLAQVRQLEG